MMAWEKTAVDNLKEIKKILDKLNIRYWLDWGTLLGAVRDRRIIEWEREIDLGTFGDNWQKILSAIPELEKKGFKVYLEEIELKRNVFERRVYLQKSGILVDIAPYQIRGEDALRILGEPTNRSSQMLKILYHILSSQRQFMRSQWKFLIEILRGSLSIFPPRLKKRLSDLAWRACRRSGIKYIKIIIPKHYFEKLEDIKFYGITFKIPYDVESYLRYHYGEDWKVPKKEWDWQEQDGSVREVEMG